MTLYSYIVTTDSGFAPNPFHGYLTLACCKPMIRRTVQVGDVVVGLSALCWLAYGIHLKDFAIIVANGINLAGAIILLVLKLSTK